MNLKILLPHRVFCEQRGVSSIVAETGAGSMGLLPHRLDCAAALVPGILMYEACSIRNYVAVDQGVLVKAGADVWVSVRRAMAGVGLEELKSEVRRSFLQLDEAERDLRVVVARMESELIRQLTKLQHV